MTQKRARLRRCEAPGPRNCGQARQPVRLPISAISPTSASLLDLRTARLGLTPSFARVVATLAFGEAQQSRPRIPEPRLRLLAERLHALGPRPLFEFLAEVLAGADPAARLAADVPERVDAIAWHQAVRFNEPGQRLHGQNLGCIIGIMTDPTTAKPTGGISRTYIHNGRKVGKAKGLGPAGIVRLSEDADVPLGLHLAKGLESALAAMSIGLRHRFW